MKSTQEELLQLRDMPLRDVFSLVKKIRGVHTPEIDLCGIVNAKSGVCGEDCKFCAQSKRYMTGVIEYPLIEKERIVQEAAKAAKNGACRFGIVTSGNTRTEQELVSIAAAIQEICSTLSIKVCASFGALTKEQFLMLKAAGLSRYHHNLETAENYYKEIVSTHQYSQRVDTVRAAKAVGLPVCSGGIIGMGESWQDRIDLACALAELDVDSVPLNILVALAGTPFAGVKQISIGEVLRTIALFRVVLEGKAIRLAAGREKYFSHEHVRASGEEEIISLVNELGLQDPGVLLYLAGSSGMMIGGYLTIAGRSVEEDLALVEEIGKFN